MHSPTIIEAKDADFEMLKQHIAAFELDNRELLKKEFLIAKLNNKLVGFGRIRNYKACSELCSLGVVKGERLKGIGKQLTTSLIANRIKPLYLVCIIPDFFVPLGFRQVDEYPIELQNKVDYCTSELCVPEQYVVMKYLGL